MHILVALALLLFNIHFETWRKIGGSWPGVLYVVFFNGLFYALSKGIYPLPWQFHSKIMKTNTLRYFQVFVIMPLLMLLFLANKPQSLVEKAIYVLKWTVGSSLIEYVGEKKQAISFYRGWNIKWSALLYVKMYTYSLMILVRPLLTLGLSVVSTVYLAGKFKIPGLFSKNGIKRLTQLNIKYVAK